MTSLAQQIADLEATAKDAERYRRIVDVVASALAAEGVAPSGNGVLHAVRPVDDGIERERAFLRILVSDIDKALGGDSVGFRAPERIVECVAEAMREVAELRAEIADARSRPGWLAPAEAAELHAEVKKLKHDLAKAKDKQGAKDLAIDAKAAHETLNEIRSMLIDAERIEDLLGGEEDTNDLATKTHNLRIAVGALIEDIECAAPVPEDDETVEVDCAFAIARTAPGSTVIESFAMGVPDIGGAVGWADYWGISVEATNRNGFATREEAEAIALKITHHPDGTKMSAADRARIVVVTEAEAMAHNRKWDAARKEVPDEGAAEGPFVIMRTVGKLGRQVFIEGPEPDTHEWVSASDLDKATKYPALEDAEGTKRGLNLRKTRIISLTDIVALPPMVPKQADAFAEAAE